MELPAGTDSNSTNKAQPSGKSGTRNATDGNNPSSNKKSGSGFFGSKSRRIKLHSSKEWQEKTRTILQRYFQIRCFLKPIITTKIFLLFT